MINVNINDDLVRVIILDISGIYVQIHNQGYFDKKSVTNINRKYLDKTRWRVIVIEE